MSVLFDELGKNRPFSADNKMVTVNGYWMDSLTGFEVSDGAIGSKDAITNQQPC